MYSKNIWQIYGMQKVYKNSQVGLISLAFQQTIYDFYKQ